MKKSIKLILKYFKVTPDEQGYWTWKNYQIKFDPKGEVTNVRVPEGKLITSTLEVDLVNNLTKDLEDYMLENKLSYDSIMLEMLGFEKISPVHFEGSTTIVLDMELNMRNKDKRLLLTAPGHATALFNLLYD